MNALLFRIDMQFRFYFSFLITLTTSSLLLSSLFDVYLRLQFDVVDAVVEDDVDVELLLLFKDFPLNSSNSALSR